MNYKENCTKGPVDYTRMLIPAREKDRRSGFVVNGPDGGPDMPSVGTNLARRICDIRTGVDVPYAMAQANAELITEAFNTLHETGYTPRELADAVKELRSALANLSNGAAVCFDDLKRSGHIAKANGQDYRKAEYEAQLVHAKYQPVTPA